MKGEENTVAGNETIHKTYQQTIHKTHQQTHHIHSAIRHQQTLQLLFFIVLQIRQCKFSFLTETLK